MFLEPFVTAYPVYVYVLNVILLGVRLVIAVLVLGVSELLLTVIVHTALLLTPTA